MGDPPAAPFRRPSGALAPLRHVAFARFLLANTTSAVGQFLQGLAVPFLINQMTDSNTWVGAAAFAALIPAVVTTPISGTRADRIDRKRILLVAYVLQGCITGGLLALHQADLLTPWPLIEKRIQAAAEADFVIVLYNPKSKKRTQHIVRAQELLLQHRKEDTPVGVVTAATRENEKITITTLGNLLDADINMQSSVIIGNSTTFQWQNFMVTPRGYADKYTL